MTKGEKIVLNAVRSRYKAGEVVDSASLRESTSLSPSDFDEICLYLGEKGYFKDLENNLARGSYVFFTTYRSDNYKEELKAERRNYIIKSVIVPIIIGTISAFITAYVRVKLG